MRFTTLTLLGALFASAASAYDTIVVKDRHFYDSVTKKPFFVKGVDYQPGGSSGVEKGKDPLSDPDVCARDVFLFQQLGVNTIRVYSIDPSLDHDACMTMLAAAGIYLILDVNTPLTNQHLHDTEPWTTYTPAYAQHIFTVIEVFSGYDNVLGFLAGNEVVHRNGSEKITPSYLKAVVRDMKGYITNHVYRSIPVGYSNADNIEFRSSLANYMECGTAGYVDFWGINSYQWCSDATFDQSGYGELVDTFKSYSLPVFFSEYGCITTKPRKWNDVRALFSDKMTGVFSGGLVYEMTETGNNYGLVTISSNGDVTLSDEFQPLAQANKDTSSPSIASGYPNTPRPTSCGSANDFPGIGVLSTLPAQLPDIHKMIVNGISSSGWKKGQFKDVKSLNLQTTKKITGADGKEITDKKIKVVATVVPTAVPNKGNGQDTGGGVGDKLPVDSPISSTSTGSSGSGSGSKNAASALSFSTFGSAAVALVVVIFSIAL